MGPLRAEGASLGPLRVNLGPLRAKLGSLWVERGSLIAVPYYKS